MREVIGRVADKWTMLALETLEQHDRLRTRLGELIGGVSQKMLTTTLRQTEADGLVVRTVFPAPPPRLDYVLSELGVSPGGVVRVWLWAEQHRAAVMAAREAFGGRKTEMLSVG